MNPIRQARLAAGLTVRELAERAGTSHSTIVAYEQGRKVPRADTRDRLIRAAGRVPLAIGPRRIRVNEAGAPRWRELVDVLDLNDALQHAPSRDPRLKRPRGPLRMPVFPERLDP